MADWPPTCWADIESYDDAEIVAGYTEYRRDEPEPGDNRSPGFRWGWANCKYDLNKGTDDGFVHIRSEGVAAYHRKRGRG